MTDDTGAPQPREDKKPMKERLSGRGEAATEQTGAPTNELLPDGQLADHWILPKEELAKGMVRPVRTQYRHEKCGTETRMPLKIAETYAREPGFYGATFCCGCRDYFRVGEHGEFVWLDGSKVGT